MKRVLSCIVSALVAVAFAGLVSAAEYPATQSAPPTSGEMSSPGGETSMGMKNDTTAKPMKKAKKKKKKAKKAKKQMKEMKDMGTMPEETPAPK
jgi:hypothetical protein